jgi:hypothetical protein
MENRLVLRLEALAHPFPLDPGAAVECWGSIRLSLQMEHQVHILLDWQWDILPLAGWFLRNHPAICNDPPALVENNRPLDSESLAQALRRLQDKDFSEKDEDEAERWFAEIFRYREKHALRFALPGADIPDIVLGNNHGRGEISCCDSSIWSYSFDMDEFCLTSEQEIRKFLENKVGDNSQVHARIREILLSTG